MVDISSFRRDAKAMRDGEWVSPGPEYGDFKVHTRALGNKFHDAVAARMKLIARNYGGEDRIPSDVRADIGNEELIKHCLIGIDGLNDGGVPVTFERFCQMIKDPSYGELSNAVFLAASMVGRNRTADLKEAAGNSERPSNNT